MSTNLSKKVLVLTSTYRSENANNFPGFVNELCEHLQPDFEIEVLTQHRPGLAIQEEKNGIAIQRFRYAPERLEQLSEYGGITNTLKEKPWTMLLVPLFLIAQLFAIRRSVKRFQPTIIHAHWIVPQGLTTVLARKLCKNKPKIVLTCHGGDLFGLRGKLFHLLKKYILKNCDRICVVSESMRDTVTGEFGIPGERVNVCPMGVFLDTTFTPDPGVKRKPGSLMFAGRLVEKKGVEYLIQALPEILKSVPDCTLTIVGGGPEQANLESKTRQLQLDRNIRFPGSVTHNELVNYYREAEIAVFPFVRARNGDMEGLGLVIVEAMGCATPVVAGNVPAVHDTVKNGETGLICDPRNTRLLAETIVSLLNDSAQRNRLGQQGRDFVVQQFAWPVCAERYREVFEGMFPGCHAT